MASADLPTHVPNDHDPPDVADPRRENLGPGARRLSGSATHTVMPMLREAAVSAGEKVAGAMGLRGWFLQLANLTAVAVGLIVNVILVLFLMDEIRAGRKDTNDRADRDRVYYTEQLGMQRENELVRTQMVVKSNDSLVSETRAAAAETRAARLSFERVEKQLEKLLNPPKKKVEGQGVPDPELLNVAPAPRPKPRT